MSGRPSKEDALDSKPYRSKQRSRFRLIREVNRGGIGVVESALDPLLGRRVAIKTLRRDLDEEDSVATKFEEEAQITGQLEHPNIIPIYDLGEESDERFIVMKLIRGRTLGELLRERPGVPQDPVGIQRFVAIMLRLCDALEYAHSRGVYHCDVKPDNVMVGDFGQVYLMDWGIALLKSRQLEAEDAPHQSRPFSIEDVEGAEHDSLIRVAVPDDGSDPLRGTPTYMAPEQLWGRTHEIGPTTDVFGLGGILGEILTGRPPNDRESLASVSFSREPVQLPDRNDYWTRLPPELRRIARKALAPAREDRHPDVAAFRADLEQYMRGGGWFETRHYTQGQNIVTEGDSGDTGYIIEQGFCRVYKSVGGQRELIRTLGPGDVFGEISVFATGPRTATIEAAGDVRVKLIDGESLKRELDQNPMLGAFVRSLATIFRETDAKLSERPSRR
jgi:eukaryotic-like serine/threonine-protein kinase